MFDSVDITLRRHQRERRPDRAVHGGSAVRCRDAEEPPTLGNHQLAHVQSAGSREREEGAGFLDGVQVWSSSGASVIKLWERLTTERRRSPLTPEMEPSRWSVCHCHRSRTAGRTESHIKHVYCSFGAIKRESVRYKAMSVCQW